MSMCVCVSIYVLYMWVCGCVCVSTHTLQSRLARVVSSTRPTSDAPAGAYGVSAEPFTVRSVNLAYRTSFSSNDIFETDLVRATNFTAPVAESPARQGVQPDPAGKIVASTQTIAWLEFECADGSTKLGVWDWVGNIYFSYIRAPRVLVRGEGSLSWPTVGTPYCESRSL